MNCLNEVTLIGHLGTNPEKIHDEPLGVRFRLATNETYFSKSKGEKITNTEWHNIKAWKQNAQYALAKMKSGDYVCVKGKIHYHNYIIEETGQKGRNSEIIATQVIKLNRDPKTDKFVEEVDGDNDITNSEVILEEK